MDDAFKYQGQHRISQVYLKQFGYLREGRWWISVWYKSFNFTENVLVENFTKETNVFDLPIFEQTELRRQFESQSGILEREYPSIIKTIRNQGQITPRHRDILCNYIPNLICRARPYRELFQRYLDDPVLRNYFLDEITTFAPDQLPGLTESLEQLRQEVCMNYVTGYVMNYLVEIIRKFSFIILKDYDNRGWFTSDNPVIIDPQEDPSEEIHEWKLLIPMESELYFPLSPDYCAFLFYPRSGKAGNALRNKEVNKVHQSDEASHERICRMIGQQYSSYFLFNQEMEPFFLDR